MNRRTKQPRADIPRSAPDAHRGRCLAGLVEDQLALATIRELFGDVDGSEEPDALASVQIEDNQYEHSRRNVRT